jgi:hypothetical protein
MSEYNEVEALGDQLKPSPITTNLILTCLGFSVPLGLYLSFVYSPTGGIETFLAIFFGTFVLGYIVTIMYYRMIVIHKSTPLDRGQLQSIAGTTAAAFMVVFLTLFALSVNPKLITIFENTIGIWYLSMMGNDSFLNEIFTSETFSNFREQSDSKIFNYNFLLTRLNENNINGFFDFKPNFKDQGQLLKLRSLVETKRTVGYFTWIYLTSVVSLMISIIAVTMKA